ncbi:MAG: MFS transporter [Propionibacteriaceae bacterium]|jgi:MFS family permease|nr:MFS transporter [Propionibacteriaceae bacterium]
MSTTQIGGTMAAKPRWSDKLPSFLRRGKVGSFLTIVMTGQLVYASFEAFKGALMLPLQHLLGINGLQYGALMGWIGIATFFYVPAGWLQNRFKVKTILSWCILWRLFTFALVYLALPSYPVLVVIAITWGLSEAVVWPAVENGVALVSRDENTKTQGLAMGLLESVRRFAEFVMSMIVVGALILFPDSADTVMRVAGLAYAATLIPLLYCVHKFVPDTKTAKLEQHSDAYASLLGLLHVMKKPRVWLAGMAALTLYWTYINLIYCSAPYLTQVFHISEGMAGAFGSINTGFIGIIAGLVAGLIADYVFKSSTKVLASALGLTVGVTAIVLLLPTGEGMLWPTMILLMVMAFATFLGKGVILAPVAELRLPEGINGSAMSVGSFLTYASVFWAYPMNGAILDANTPEVGYRIIFTITLVISAVGLICGIVLLMMNKHAEQQEAALVA